ncbi:hypothetical protein V6N13_062039 [Hibiscus sabdariffa]
MVNDGVIMAKVDELEDLVEDIEVKLVRQLVSKTIDLFGDGTATLVVLVQEVQQEPYPIILNLEFNVEFQQHWQGKTSPVAGT